MQDVIIRNKEPGERGSIASASGSGQPYRPWIPRDVIGTRVPRLDARAKVTGGAKYTVDIRLDGMLYAAVLRSPHAAAQVLSVDTTEAAKLPGVRAILTFNGKVIRNEGAEVAAVAADTLDQAKDAVAALKVQYEVYDSVVTVEDAMASDAPQVYSDRSNVGSPSERSKGDYEQGFADADLVVEAEYRTQIQTHSPMETHSAVVYWESATRLVAYVSTQGVFSTASELADYFGLKEENVRVICDYIGGGFGCKVGAGLVTTMAAELSQLAGRPVKLQFDRKGEQLVAGNRPDSIQQTRLGLKADGSITAVEVVGYATPGIGSGAGFAEAFRSLYDFGAYHTVEYQVYTNCGTAMTMRAPGSPPGVFSLECLLDEAAYGLGLDPLDVRLRNNSSRIRAKQFELGAERFGWYDRNPEPGADSGPVKRGMGMASATWFNPGYGGSTVRTTINRDGSVLVENGANDIGTGTRTWMAMLVAEELGLTPEQIDVHLGDTTLPYGPTAAGSGTTPCLSPCTRESGENARLALAAVVGPLLGAPAEELVFADGMITAPGGESMSFAEACGLLPSPIVAEGTRQDDAKLTYDMVTGVHFAEVEVDTRSGKVRVLRVLAIHDAGRILNLLTAESQVMGGVIQGMHYALFEERVMDRNLGKMLNSNLESYKIGGSKDMPQIEVDVQDISMGGTYVGALGLGECPVIPTAAAIGNAVYHAIGARVRSIPMTPARVLEALGTVQAARSTRRKAKGGKR